MVCELGWVLEVGCGVSLASWASFRGQASLGDRGTVEMGNWGELDEWDVWGGLDGLDAPA